MEDTECNTPGLTANGVCLDIGSGGGRCTRVCDDALPCLDGFYCETKKPYGEDGPELHLCVTDDPANCVCTAKFVAQNAQTECYVQNEMGTCTALLTCVEQGPVPECGAPAPTQEICNGVDDDCDGETDEDADGCVQYHLDTDGDGYGQGVGVCLCEAPEPEASGAIWLTQGGDCNELSSSVNPGATEVCNGYDDNCDESVDESGAQGCNLYYADVDGDGDGDPEQGECVCGAVAPAGWSTSNGDCNDSAPAISGDAQEVCNFIVDIDEDCDGVTDEEGAEGCIPYFLDGDGDGFGLTEKSKCLCGPIGTYSAPLPGDCNDALVLVNPEQWEVCNGVDDDCDGQTDEGEEGDMCPQVANGLAGCVDGLCELVECHEGWSDADGDPDNGCECSSVAGIEDVAVGGSCAEPYVFYVMGENGEPVCVTLPGTNECQFDEWGNIIKQVAYVRDNPATELLVSDNIAPIGDEDWYMFTTIDVPDEYDTYSLSVDFLHNPQEQFAFDVYKDGCAAFDQKCQASTWYTESYDFSVTLANGFVEGESPCAADPDDTTETKALCTDNSGTFYVRVFRKSDAAPACAFYTLRIRNGYSSLGVP